MSASTIAFVSALVIGGTGAFFSDTETSTANVFTAGAIDLKVDSQQHYNGNECVLGDYDLNPDTPDTGQWVGTSPWPVPTTECYGTWLESDLGPSQKFFDFEDVKPGDSGENTISLHVFDNEAYACADLSNILNLDNEITEPEDEVGGPANDDGTPTGDLAQNLDFLVWSDNGAGSNAGNNIWDADEVGDNTSGGAPTADMSFPLAVPGNPLPGGQTRYLGFVWCAGTFIAGGAGITPVCDGSTMGNIAQTDSYQADITMRVEQARNNPNFSCTPQG